MPNLKLVVTDDSGNEYETDLPLSLVAAPAPEPEPTPEPTPEPEPEPTPDPVPEPEPSTIPLSKSDARFATNVAGPTGYINNGLLTNKKWDQSPTYSTGEQVFTWTGNGSDVLTIDKAIIDAREGPRIAAGSTARATLNITDSLINCVGKGTDHADGIQAYSPGGVALVDVKRTCFRSYTDQEARAKYGTGFIGSCAFFWADAMKGEVRFTDVVIFGGGRGVAIYADTGTTRISFENVYFVPSPDGWTYFDYDIRATGGNLIIDKWVNVCAATIDANGNIVPGAQLPKP